MNGDKEESPDGSAEEMDYIVTGGVDDCVKIWSFEDKKLKLNHKLDGHSLGVVSVALNSDGTSESYDFALCSVFKQFRH